MEKYLDTDQKRFGELTPKNEELIFDLDGTLVTYNKKQRLNWDFPQFIIDWMNKNKTAKISIVSNQKNCNDAIREKIKNILIELRKYLIVDLYLSISNDWYRKPSPKIFVDCILKPNKSYIYVGDAAGRKDDFSDSDRLFAYNSDIIAKTVNSSVKFATPERFFLDQPQKLPKIIPIFPPDDQKKEKEIKKVIDRLSQFQKNIVIMCGPPGSGKSYFSDHLVCELEVFDGVLSEKSKVIVTRDKENTHTVDVEIIVLNGKLTNKKIREISENNIIIWDTTGYTKTLRAEVISNFPDHNPTIVWLKTTEKERKWLRFYRTIENNITIPDIAIRIQDSKFEEPTSEELSEKNKDGIIIINTFDTIDQNSLGLEGKFLC